jgi:hypothetical protein
MVLPNLARLDYTGSSIQAVGIPETSSGGGYSAVGRPVYTVYTYRRPALFSVCVYVCFPGVTVMRSYEMLQQLAPS